MEAEPPKAQARGRRNAGTVEHRITQYDLCMEANGQITDLISQVSLCSYSRTV